MSKYTKKTLAVALVAALTIPTAALAAFQLQTDGDRTPETIASQAGLNVTMDESVDLVTELRDVIIGRTTGFQVLVTIEDGATFSDVAPVLTPGEGLDGVWTVVLAAGGTEGSVDAQFTVSPTTAGATVSEGAILQFLSLELDNVRTNGTTRMSVQLRDPVSGAMLHSDTHEIIDRNSGLTVSCTATPNPDRIDVGGENPKATFVEYQGAAGYPIGAGEATTTDLGTISFAASSGFEFGATTILNSQIAGDFTGFTSVYLVDAEASCSATPLASYEFNDARTQATLAQAGVFTSTSGGTATLCVAVDGTTPIAAQEFQVTNGVDGNWLTGTDAACPVADLDYNGSVVKVYHVNPAGNTTAQSFVRVINPSNVPGRVTITGIDDAGISSPNSVSFDLPARGSMQVNSEDLENGNADKGLTGSLGDGAGKWRLEVTGEFEGMLVQGLNRNTTNGTVTNLTDADSGREQRIVHDPIRLNN